VVKADNGEKSYYLYDDNNDPYQLNNNWGTNPDLDKKLEGELINLLTNMNDPW
jgi:hypothetical protein